MGQQPPLRPPAERELDDGIVRLREWADSDAAWYAQSVRDPLILRFTSESPTLQAEQVVAAMNRLRASETEAGFLICDAVTGVKELTLRVHQDNAASLRVAVRAGYQRAPEQDQSREIKGATWPMLAFKLTQATR